MTAEEPGFSTLSIHAGARPDPTSGARVTPIYQTTASRRSAIRNRPIE